MPDYNQPETAVPMAIQIMNALHFYSSALVRQGEEELALAHLDAHFPEVKDLLIMDFEPVPNHPENAQQVVFAIVIPFPTLLSYLVSEGIAIMNGEE